MIRLAQNPKTPPLDPWMTQNSHGRIHLDLASSATEIQKHVPSETQIGTLPPQSFGLSKAKWKLNAFVSDAQKALVHRSDAPYLHRKCRSARRRQTEGKSPGESLQALDVKSLSLASMIRKSGPPLHHGSSGP